MTKAINKLPLLFAGIISTICICIIEFIPFPNIWVHALVRFGLAAICIVFTYIINRRNVFVHPFKNFKEVLIDCAYPVGIALFAGIVTFVQELNTEEIAPNAALNILSVVLLCISVGLFEEGLFRLCMGDAAIAQFGKSKKCFIATAIITSFIFGFVHVAFDITPDVLTNRYAMLSVIFKTAQAMAVGFLFIAVFWKTKSFVGVALMHCLNDLFAMLPIVLFGQTIEDSYVSEDPSMITGYVVILFLYIPVVAVGIRVFKEVLNDLDKEQKKIEVIEEKNNED